MKQIILLIFFLTPSLGFTQMLERKTDLSGKTGIQLGEFYASSKGKGPGEAYYFNTLLYYRNRYIIKDDEVIGTLSGRLTKEEPLSSLSYIALESLRNPQASYSNLLQAYPQYYDALSNYDLFIRLFEDSLKKAAQAGTTNGQVEEQPSREQYLEDYTEYLPLEGAPPEEILEGSPAMDVGDELVFLQKSPQKAAFQEISTNFSIPVPAEPFPPLGEVLKDSTKSFSAKELEFLIRYEELNRAYSNTVIEYQKVLAAKRLLEQKPSFDPADPSEPFRILISGEDTGMVWVKNFSLDGEKNYQSYDKNLWFLRYELPLTKKDVRILANIYLKSKPVSFQVMGKGGAVDFTLSAEQTAAFKRLFEDYVFGKMVQPELDFELTPLLK